MLSNRKPLRTWQEISEEAGREHDPDKLKQLSEELEHSLDERAKKLRSQDSPAAKKHGAG